MEIGESIDKDIEDPMAFEDSDSNEFVAGEIMLLIRLLIIHDGTLQVLFLPCMPWIRRRLHHRRKWRRLPLLSLHLQRQ